ncbi:MAG: sugar phosphate isomerase/epimerase [Planctomycetota bacterium]|nr:MAG: sugar phosphate isomerase/epimerase [Planctomycetota bacterium]
MKLGLINSAWAQANRDTVYGLTKTREIGFDTVDIFADPLDISIEERELIRRTCKDLDLPIISVACVALGLIDFNPSVRRFHLERCKRYLEMTADFSGRNLLLVLGEYVWQREVIPPTDQWQFGVESLQDLGEYAQKLGLEIVMEMEPFRESLLNDIPKMKRFLDDVTLREVKANLDISHMVLANQSAELLNCLKGQIGHIHISDCDGKVHGDLPPGRGVVDFKPYLKKIEELGLNQDDIVMSIELEYSPEPDQIESWVTEAYFKTAELMRNAKLRV